MDESSFLDAVRRVWTNSYGEAGAIGSETADVRQQPGSDSAFHDRPPAGVTTGFTWDVNAGLPVVLDDGNQYVYGAGLVSQKQGAAWSYYLADGLGSTLAIVNASGAVQNSYTYDVYGKPTKTGTLANEFDFAGQQTDATGLQYLRARYMDPETGTFLSREPLSVSPEWTGSPTAYAAGNPATMADPSGQRPCYGDDCYHPQACILIFEDCPNDNEIIPPIPPSPPEVDDGGRGGWGLAEYLARKATRAVLEGTACKSPTATLGTCELHKALKRCAQSSACASAVDEALEAGGYGLAAATLVAMVFPPAAVPVGIADGVGAALLFQWVTYRWAY